jgi:TPR repeat protein
MSSIRIIGLSGLLSLINLVHAADLDAGLAAAARRDWAKALAEFVPLANQGNPAAEINLGNLYMKGLGVQQDYGKALYWYRKAANQGDAAGQSKLGLLYYYGLGVPVDYGEAARWFRKAAEQGEIGAQTILGSLYSLGNGVVKNPAEAYFWYTLAAEQGSQNAQEAKDSLLDEMSPGEINQALDRLQAWPKLQEPKPVVAALPVRAKPQSKTEKTSTVKKRAMTQEKNFKPTKAKDKKKNAAEKKK